MKNPQEIEINELVDKIKELHEKGWVFELRFGHHCEQPHYMVVAMKDEWRFLACSMHNMKEALEKIFKLIDE